MRAALLADCFAKHVTLDPRVVLGPRVGEDAAVLDMGDRYLVATTDPITFVTEDLGWYALVVNANDLAVRGAAPRWFLATCLLPEGRTTEGLVVRLFAQLGTACRELGVSLVGGHTEITHGLDRPIVVGTMLGEVAKDRLVTTGGARPGDVLLLTKGIPLEGTSIIARIRADELRARGYAEATLARARDYLGRLSVVPEAAGVGLRVEADRVPVLAEGGALCAEFGLDPLGTIASGALLVALGPADAGVLLHALAREGIDGAFIGRVVPPGEGVTLVRAGHPVALPRFEQDEITRLLA